MTTLPVPPPAETAGQTAWQSKDSQAVQVAFAAHFSASASFVGTSSFPVRVHDPVAALRALADEFAEHVREWSGIEGVWIESESALALTVITENANFEQEFQLRAAFLDLVRPSEEARHTAELSVYAAGQAVPARVRAGERLV